MKRLLAALLAAALLLTLCACGTAPVPAETTPVPAETEPVPDEAEPAPAEAEPAPAETEPSAEPAAVEETPETPAAEPDFRFSTTALDGTAFDESVFAEASLTMINFFEPWCPPCVAELPELEKLYENYRDQGFRILGVFSDEEGVEDVLAEAAVSYPALRYVPAFDQFQTGYVPTTIFVNGQGKIVGETQIGSNSYAGWEAIVKELLG